MTASSAFQVIRVRERLASHAGPGVVEMNTCGCTPSRGPNDIMSQV